MEVGIYPLFEIWMSSMYSNGHSWMSDIKVYRQHQFFDKNLRHKMFHFMITSSILPVIFFVVAFHLTSKTTISSTLQQLTVSPGHIASCSLLIKKGLYKLHVNCAKTDCLGILIWLDSQCDSIPGWMVFWHVIGCMVLWHGNSMWIACRVGIYRLSLAIANLQKYHSTIV